MTFLSNSYWQLIVNEWQLMVVVVVVVEWKARKRESRFGQKQDKFLGRGFLRKGHARRVAPGLQNANTCPIINRTARREDTAGNSEWDRDREHPSRNSTRHYITYWASQPTEPPTLFYVMPTAEIIVEFFTFIIQKKKIYNIAWKHERKIRKIILSFDLFYAWPANDSSLFSHKYFPIR